MDFNINTTQAQANQAGDLDDNGNFLGDSLGMNALKQAEQSQLVAQATEKTKMAKLGSKQKTEADDAGINPETKDYMSKEEALTYIMHEWKVDETDPEVQKLVASLPEMVERHMIQTLIRKRDRFAGKPVGTPFQAKAGNAYPAMSDGTGAVKLNPGQWYEAFVSDDGNVSYIPSGESAAHINHDGRDDKSMRKEWVKLAYDMDPTGASSRKALGINYSSYVAALRGQNLLSQPVVTIQNLGEVTRDLTRILQQGVPTDAGSEGMMYHSLVGDIMKKIQYFGGKPQDALPDGMKAYLADSFERLKAVSADVIELKIHAMEAAFPDVISAHQNEWDNLVATLRKPPTPNMDSYQPHAAPDEGGVMKQLWHRISGSHNAAAPVDSVDKPVDNAPAATRKTASGVTYTVSE